MNPFTIAALRVHGASPATADGTAAAPAGDLFSRLLACLPTRTPKDEDPFAAAPQPVKPAEAASAVPFAAAALRIPGAEHAALDAEPDSDEQSTGGDDEPESGTEVAQGAPLPLPDETAAAIAAMSLQGTAGPPCAPRANSAAGPHTIDIRLPATGADIVPIANSGPPAAAATASNPAEPVPGTLPPSVQQALAALPGLRTAGSEPPAGLTAARTVRADGDEAVPAPAASPAAASLQLQAAMVPPQPQSDPVRGADEPAPALPAPPDSSIDQAVTRHLDLAHETQWLDRLATDIARTAGKDGSLRFSLHPETLGALQVEVRHAAAGVSIRLSAENETARAILVDAQPRLAAEARAHGVRISETHVDVGGHSAGSDNRGQRPAPPEPLLRTAGAALEEPRGTPPTINRPAPAERYA